MNSRTLGIAFAGVLIALAWFARPSTPHGASLGRTPLMGEHRRRGCGTLERPAAPGQGAPPAARAARCTAAGRFFWSQPRLSDLAVIAVAAMVVTVLVVFQGQHTPLLEYLWLLRFPLVLAAVLALLPFIFESFFRASWPISWCSGQSTSSS